MILIQKRVASAGARHRLAQGTSLIARVCLFSSKEDLALDLISDAPDVDQQLSHIIDTADQIGFEFADARVPCVRGSRVDDVAAQGYPNDQFVARFLPCKPANKVGIVVEIRHGWRLEDEPAIVGEAPSLRQMHDIDNGKQC